MPPKATDFSVTHLCQIAKYCIICNVFLGVLCPRTRNEDKMPYAVLEKEIERLDETQQNTVVQFVRFLLSQKAAAPVGDGEARPRRYDFSRVAGHLKLREDPVAFQRRIRDEW